MNIRGTEKKTEKGMEKGTNIDGKRTERINISDQRKGKRKVTYFQVIDEETLFFVLYGCVLISRL